MSFGAVIPAMVLTQVVPAGAGAIVKVKGLEVPSGLATVTLALPAVAKSVAGTLAVAAVALLHVATLNLLSPQVVVSATPFHWTAAPSLKLEPYTMIVVAEAPTGATEGAIPTNKGGSDVVPPLPFPPVPPPAIEVPEPHPRLAKTAIVPSERRVERIIWAVLD